MSDLGHYRKIAVLKNNFKKYAKGEIS